jgi:nucleotide-binding universal stress UspA family protein
MSTQLIQRILIPTDMSDFATLALEYGLLFRDRLGAQLTLLYAEEFDLLLSAEYPLGYYFDNVSEAKSHALELLRNYSRQEIKDVTGVRTLVLDSSPARAIVQTADDIRADLIIMGTHGRHGLRRTLLGSVTERVLRETGRPLLTVVPGQFPAQRRVDIKKILCPVNFTAIAQHALEYAMTFAATFGAELREVSVPEDRDSTDPAERILKIADDYDADLIVIGAQHTRFSDATVIGTTTERITRFAKQPVLTVMRRAEALRRKDAELQEKFGAPATV